MYWFATGLVARFAVQRCRRGHVRRRRQEVALPGELRDFRERRRVAERGPE
jgi:hypothetical protein